MIKFYRGLKDSYSIAAHGADIYFATDTLEILHGGNSYSGLHQETKSITDIDVVDGIINITYTDNSTNKIDIAENWSLIATHTSDITQLKETDKSLDDRLIIIEGNFKDGKLDIDLTPITELLTDHSTRIETLENSSVAKDTFEAYKSSANTTFATKTSVNNKVDKVSGKQLSTNDFTNELKTKLENSNIYKHQFRTLSALPDSGDGWYSIASIGDTESSIVQISSGGHTDVQVAINTGWAGNTTGSLTVLNSFIDDTNNNHAYVKAVRLRKIPNSNNGTAVLEAKINRTGYYTYTLYVNIVVSVFTNAGHNIITTNSENSQALLLINDDSNILQEFTLIDKAIMAKNIIAETITADNLQNYKTKQSAKSSPTASSSTDYLFIDTITQNANGEITATKKTVRSASRSQSGLMSASDKTKLDSFQSANTYLTEHQDISGKQDKLISGTNIKTINNTSILGSGNITIQGGSGGIPEVLDKEIYYNDGSNEVVPIKHPDLSTQPSILPYKFMGQYVYEQLIPVKVGDRIVDCNFEVKYPMILSAGIFGVNSFKSVDIIATKSDSLLLDSESELGGYINVQYTDASQLLPSNGYGYGYGYEDNNTGSSTLIDFGVSDDGTIYTYDPNTEALSLYKSGGITQDSIPTNYYNNAKKIILKNGVTSIGSSTFWDYWNLTSITIPVGVTSIGDGAFRNCSSLTSITIPDSVTSIRNYAFDSCRSLTAITLPKTVTSIGGLAFAYCYKLKSINIPEGVKNIEWSAFKNCNSLNKITIPATVTNIGSEAFSYCSSLTSITSRAITPPSLDTSTFMSVSKSIPVYVPAESVDTYKAAEVWSEFTNIQAI